MFNLILFGPPGSGKGTQSENIVEKYKLIHLSTGNLLREEIGGQTALGLEAKSFMDKGQLVPDQVVIKMIDSALEHHKDAAGFLFDGFPRTDAQAEALDQLLTRKKTEIALVIGLDVSEEELIKRLLNRGKTSGRSDDTIETIHRRFTVYKNETAPIAQHYKNLNRFVNIEGEGSVEEIFDAICDEINKRKTSLAS